jgi:putative peptidoglycan lipid II flippase
MSSHKQVTQAAGVVGFSTVITRILGFLRDMVIALTFGAGMETDAYLVAFRIPSMLRRLVGEGALTVAFIPVFVEQWHQDEQRAWKFANTVATLLSLILISITLLGVLLTPYFVKLIAPGFTALPVKFALTTDLTRITFPYILFISLAALTMGILNSLQHFFAPALAPIMLNISLIGCAFFLCPYLKPPVTGLAIGVILGGVTQFLFQIPALIKRGFRYRISFDYKNPAVQKVGLLMLPAFFGLAIAQLAVFTDTLFASFLADGSVAYLFYADRLIEFPLGIFGMAVATAVLPTMSTQTAKGEYDQLVEVLSFALRLVLFIMIPSAVGLIVLRMPIVTTLFQHGKFTLSAAQATSQAVLYYALGVPAIASNRVITPVFYSLKDTATPVKCGAAALVMNIIANALLIKPLKHGGLALATSLSASFNLILLIWLLRKRLGQIGWKSIVRSAGKVSLAAIVMGLSCAPFATQATQHLWILLTVMLSGAGVFLGCAWLVKSEELLFLKTLVLERFAPINQKQS